MAALMSMSAPQPAPAPDLADLIDPFATRTTRSDATPRPSDLIDPFNRPPRQSAPVECSESVLRDPFATPARPRTTATFPGLIDPFAP